MGAAYSAELMDVIMQILCTTGITQCTSTPLNVKTTVHIDNVRYLGDENELLKSAAQFLKNCELVGVTVNKEPNVNVPHSEGIFCGVQYDYKNALTTIPEKGLAKLRHAIRVFQDNRSVRNMTALFGMLFHLSPIVGSKLSKRYHPLKYYRRKMSALQHGLVKLDDPASLWHCINNGMTEWCDSIFANTPTSHTPSSVAEANLFTDASDAGWGAYYIDPTGDVHIVAGSWSARDRSRSINEREAMAVANALDAFKQDLVGVFFNLHIDNSSILHGVRKGYSAVYNINERIKEVHNILRDITCKFTVCYVPSAMNLADDPSRRPHVYATGSEKAQLSSPSGIVGLNSVLPTR